MVTGALRAGVVRFVVCANDVGDSASTRVTDKINEIRDKRLRDRFIRELIVLNVSGAALLEHAC